MTAGLVMPELSVEIAMGGTYWAPTDWTDVTRQVSGFSITRGRQHELTNNEAGALELDFYNIHGDFSPWNTSSPYYGNLSPGQGVRITATWNGVSYPVFAGSVDSWIPSYGQVLGKQVVKGTDAMGLLALMPCVVNDYVQQVLLNGPVLFWQFQDPPGSMTAADSSGAGATGQIAAQAGVTFGVPGGLQGVTNTALEFPASTFLYTDIVNSTSVHLTGDVSMDILVHSTVASSFIPVQVFLAGNLSVSIFGTEIYATVGSIQVGPVSVTVDDGDWHHVGMTYHGSTGATVVYIDGTAVLSGTGSTGQATGGPMPIDIDLPDGGEGDATDIEAFAIYPTVLSPATMAIHAASVTALANQQSGDMIRTLLLASGVPSAAIGTIATGLSLEQAPSVTVAQTQLLSTVQTAETTEQGFFFVDESGLIQFYDRHYLITNTSANTSQGIFASDNDPTHYHYLSGSLVPGLDDVDLWNDTAVQSQNGTLYEEQDMDSQSRYGRRLLSGYTGMMYAEDADSQSLAQWLLHMYSQPLVRIRSMGLDNTAGNGANFPQMLGRKLLDRITLKWQPLDGSNSPFVQDSNIEQIQHVVTKTSWKTTWALAPTDTLHYMVYDDPVYGVLDADNAYAY